MRWVKLTLPPRARRRWLLITMRLSMSSFTGTARTLVAVGMVRLRSMFLAVRAEAPRSTSLTDSCGSGLLALADMLGSAGVGARTAPRASPSGPPLALAATVLTVSCVLASGREAPRAGAVAACDRVLGTLAGA